MDGNDQVLEQLRDSYLTGLQQTNTSFHVVTGNLHYKAIDEQVVREAARRASEGKDICFIFGRIIQADENGGHPIFAHIKDPSHYLQNKTDEEIATAKKRLKFNVDWGKQPQLHYAIRDGEHACVEAAHGFTRESRYCLKEQDTDRVSYLCAHFDYFRREPRVSELWESQVETRLYRPHPQFEDFIVTVPDLEKCHAESYSREDFKAYARYGKDSDYPQDEKSAMIRIDNDLANIQDAVNYRRLFNAMRRKLPDDQRKVLNCLRGTGPQLYEEYGEEFIAYNGEVIESWSADADLKEITEKEFESEDPLFLVKLGTTGLNYGFSPYLLKK